MNRKAIFDTLFLAVLLTSLAIGCGPMPLDDTDDGGQIDSGQIVDAGPSCVGFVGEDLKCCQQDEGSFDSDAGACWGDASVPHYYSDGGH